MSEKMDGGPAFPSEGEGHGNPEYHSPGMSLRDYFAAAALTGMLAADKESGAVWHAFAGDAYRAADAMIRARMPKARESSHD